MPPSEPTTTARPTGNPYVGPRAFRADDKSVFFGRDREIAELADLLRAERVVFLHAPSGAGKTSLINAGLIPTLREEFEILPPVRMNAVVRPGVNRYVFSTLMSLDTAGEGSQVHPVLGDPSALSMDAYLRARPRANPCGPPQLLIFDQFEEVLSLDPYDADAKKVFFRELAVALRKSRQPVMADATCPVGTEAPTATRWALFAIRDEYLAGLLPYFRLLPAGLGETFRLDRPSRRAALDAVVRPAQTRGVSFEAGTDSASGAAEMLVDRLSMVRPFIDSDRSTVEPPAAVRSDHVEPVFLQIVCQRLWDDTVGRDPTRQVISREDVSRIASVENALGRYYRDQVRSVAAAVGVDEGRIRAWVGQRLISPRHLRMMVVRGSDEHRELGDEAVQRLEQAHLLRREARTTGVIYELAHDCLIAPVENDNATFWEAQPRGLLQPKADLWQAQARGSEQLLTDAELREADEWAGKYAGRIRPLDRDFLEASRRAAADRRRARRVQLIVFAAVGVCLAVIAIWIADRQIQRVKAGAEKQAAEAKIAITQKQMEIVQGRQGLARAQALMDTDPEAAVVEATWAVNNLLGLPDSDPDNPNLTAEARQQLRDDVSESVRRAEAVLNLCLQVPRCRQTLAGHREEVNAVACARGGNRFATGDESGLILLWERDGAATDWPANGRALPSLGKPVSGLAFDPMNANRLASAGDAGLHLWDLSANPPVSKVFAATGPPAVTKSYSTVSFSHAGNYLAAGTDQGTILIWDLAGPGPARLVRTLSPGDWRWGGFLIPGAPRPSVNRVAFSPVPDADGNWVLASAWSDGRARLWRRADEAGPWQTIPRVVDVPGRPTLDGLRSVTFDSRGRRLATAGEDGTARIWEVSTGHLLRTCYASQDRVNDIAFSADDSRLVTVTRDREAQVWHLSPDVVKAFKDPDPGGPGRAAPVPVKIWSPLIRLHGHRQIVTATAFLGPDVVTVSDDRTIKVWRPDETKEYFTPFELQRESVRRMALSPGGESFAAAVSDAGRGDEGTSGARDGVFVWDAGANGSTKRFIEATQVTALAFDPTGQTLVLGRDPGELLEYRRSPDGSFRFVQVWPVARLVQAGDPTLDWLLGVRIHQIRFSPNGRYLAAACAIEAKRGGEQSRPDGIAVVWDMNSPPGRPVGHEFGRKLFWDVTVSPDGRWIAATGNTGITHLRSLGPGGLGSRALLKYTLAAEPGPGSAGDRPGTAAVVGAEKEGDSGSVYAAAFNQVGTRLATGHHDGTVVVWQLGPDGEPRPELILRPGTLAVRCLAFLPGTEWLAAGSYDQTVRIWDLAAITPTRSAPIYTLTGPRGWVTEVVWQPSRDLLVLSTDKSVRRFHLDRGELRKAATSAVTEPWQWARGRE